MRVLFTAHGAYGHVLPMVGVARALADCGDDVRVATGESLCPTVASLGLEAVRAGIGDDDLVAEAHRRWPETRHQSPASWAVRMFSDIAAPAMLADLAPIIDSWRPHLVVREEGEHGGPIAAAAANVPWVTHAWGSPLPSQARLEELAESLAPLWRTAGVTARCADGLYGAAVLDPCPLSLYGAGGPEVSARPLRATAPAMPGEHHPRRSPSGRALTYVGFGTVPLYRDQPDLIELVVTALLSHDSDVVITTGDADLAARLTSRDPRRVQARRWVSLPGLLESCDLVVSHGGAGTVLAALTAGTPLLLLPRGAPSQARMSEACAARGAARTVPSTRITAATINAALRSLFADDRFRTAAQQVAKEIASTPGPEDAARSLRAIARDRDRRPRGARSATPPPGQRHPDQGD